MENTIALFIENLHQRYQEFSDGAVADYIPELAKQDPSLFGICVVTTDGHAYEVGDTDKPFTIQSISKAFTYGAILDEHGFEEVGKRIGVEPSGEAFNSISLDPVTGRPLNPMINAGAIAATGMIPGKGFHGRFEEIRRRFSNFAGRELDVDEAVYKSESDTGFRNRAIAHLLRNFEMLDDPVEEAVEVYFKQCAILVNARDLAVMGASLANGGVNPLSGTRVIEHANVEKVLSVMSTCGMYDYSGEWIFNVGLPAKSGVGGGIMGVLPGQLAVAVFSPPLDPKGNSVRGLKVFGELSKHFNLHLLNYPVISDQVIRRVYKLSEIGSRRQRPTIEHEVIREHGSIVKIVELQGDVFFTAFERVVRGATSLANETETFILDLNRVGFIDNATETLLMSVAEQLAEEDKKLIVVDPARKLDHGRFNGLTDTISFVEEIDNALEDCEEKVITRHIEKPMVGGLFSFHEFDLFKGMSARELSVIEGMLEMAEYPADSKVITEGDEPDEIFLLAKGSVSVYHEDMKGGERGGRINSFGAGVCFGDIAVVDGSARSADVWADERITCYTLSRSRLEELCESYPHIYAAILRNLLILNFGRLRRRNLEIAALKT